jgi:hypothetical protein
VLVASALFKQAWQLGLSAPLERVDRSPYGFFSVKIYHITGIELLFAKITGKFSLPHSLVTLNCLVQSGNYVTA